MLQMQLSELEHEKRELEERRRIAAQELAKKEALRKATNPSMEELVEMNMDDEGTLWLDEKRLNRRRPDELQMLSKAIARNARQVQALTLYGNQLDDLQLEELLPGLRKLRRLKELRLDCNQLSEISCNAINIATKFWPKLTRYIPLAWVWWVTTAAFSKPWALQSLSVMRGPLT